MPPQGITPPTPNELYVNVRRIYVRLVLGAMPLLFLAVVAAANKVGGSILPALLLIAGVVLLIFANVARASARCPRCTASLIWKPAPMGMGRLSLGMKSRCASCGLDLNQPWAPPADAEGDAIAPSEPKKAGG